MKRLAILFCVLLLILTGCKEPLEDSSDSVHEEEEQTEAGIENDSFKKLITSRATFHFVVDWLTDSEILFVEKNEDVYAVKSFNIRTGETRTIYEDSMIIANVLIHPEKEYLLLHTTDNPYSATIKVVSIDGIVHNEASVESSELHVEWNDMNPFNILLTAFQQDWSYDVFLFDGLKNNLRILSIDHPFPKWLGENQLIFTSQLNHPLDGEKLYSYNIETEKVSDYGQEDVIFYDTYKDSLLYMQINENEQSEYTIENIAGDKLSHWSMPAISNYSEWVIPEIHWIASDSLYLLRAQKGSQLDEMEEPLELIKVAGNEQSIVHSESSNFTIKCSEDSKRCLSGDISDRVIDLTNGREDSWLLFSDE